MNIDLVITITSYDRYDLLKNLIDQILTQKTKYNYKIIVIDDGSKDNRYNEFINYNDNLIFTQNETNGGKINYYDTINKIWSIAKNFNSKYILQSDDDFYLCDNFIDTLILEFETMKTTENNLVGLCPHLYSFSKKSDYELNWFSTNTIDGIGLFEFKILKAMDFKLQKPKNDVSKIGASVGIWQQITNAISSNGWISKRSKNSLVYHNNTLGSKLHTELRKSKMIFTQRFISEVPKHISDFDEKQTIKPNNNKKKSVTSSGNITQRIAEPKSKPIPQDKPEIKSQISSKPQKLFNPDIESKPKPEVKKEQPKPIKPAIEVTPIVKTIEPEQPIVKPEPLIAKPNAPQIKSPIKSQPRDNTAKSSISRIPNDLDIGRLRKQRLNFGRR